MNLISNARLGRLSACSLVFLTLLCAASPAAGSQDKAPSLKSKDATERLAATRALIAGGGGELPKQLLKLLKDDDWEIELEAARALGNCAGEKALAPLVALASEGPIRELRAMAALSLAKIGAQPAVAALGKKLKPKTALAACEALILIGPPPEEFELPRGLPKLLKSKDLRVRAAAAGALVALAHEERGMWLGKLLASEHLAVRARALQVAADQPLAAQVPALREFFATSELDDVVLRRALAALAAGVGAVSSERGALLKEILGELCKEKDPRVARRAALLAEFVAHSEWGGTLDLLEFTAAARTHADPGVRAGAARLLQIVGGHAGLDAAQELYETDGSLRVRRAALASLLKLQPVTENAARGWIVEALSSETQPELRQDLVVALGDKQLAQEEEAARALIAALGDSDWGVAACAAVSLGLTRSDLGPEPLSSMARDSDDWRRRGAALVGLTKSLHKAAIPGVIAALADPEPLVVRSAHAYLVSINRGQVLAPEREVWTHWWAEHEAKIRLRDPREQQERNAKYGYEASPEVIYRGLDVVVLEARGDHIQTILEQLGINHRLTHSSQVQEDGLDAGGVFVSNCTGELEPADIERLVWFVKVGGYLCGSCWALTETIERIEPGVVTKLETRDEIMDDVLSSPCDLDSPYTEGVFGEYVVPIYHLEGAHLIEVLQPERVEMLVDSVECAEKWGGGNLACWFSSGHGTILDSANHFYGQGLENVSGLKKPQDRMAYAVDHMGTSLERIRSSAGQKFWTSNHRAAQEIFDLSVFRLVTNFVRLRRLEGR